MTTITTPIPSKTLFLQNPNHHHRIFLIPSILSLRQNPSFHQKLPPLTLKPLRISASSSTPPYPSQSPLIKPKSTLTDSTRTVTTLIALAATAIRQLGLKIRSLRTAPTPEEMANLHSLQEALTCTVGPMFFAAIRSRPSGALNTPLTVVAAGLSKWLDIYSGVLLVRVLLSWFPNIPWDRQPLSAIRDLCDPYLNLFRNIIPPIFDTLDVSPLLAFAVLGALSSLLTNSRGV